MLINSVSSSLEIKIVFKKKAKKLETSVALRYGKELVLPN